MSKCKRWGFSNNSHEKTVVCTRVVGNIGIGNKVKNVSITLHAGEILGLAGMVGSGRTELAHAVFGSLPMNSGEVHLGSHTYTATTPRRSIKRGIGFLTEDRKAEGLVLGMNIRTNITAPILERFVNMGFIDFNTEKSTCLKELQKYSIARLDLAASGRMSSLQLAGF